MNQDVSSDFRWNKIDGIFAELMVQYEGTPMMLMYFVKFREVLSDYAYWFFLSTIWVSSSNGDLVLWKKLLSSHRSKRKTSIMKPSELAEYKRLPNVITVYRAHRENEVDWIAYTLDKQIAEKFAKERGAKEIRKYAIKKKDVLALFLRRGESEILMLNKDKARLKEILSVS